MTKEEKLSILAVAMDLDVEALKENTVLSSFEEWDSLAQLSFLSILTKQGNNKIKPKDIAALVTVGDALNLLE